MMNLARKRILISLFFRKDEISYFLLRRNVDALAKRLEYLIKHPEIWSKMGHVGRMYVEDNYDIDKLNDQLVDIYQKLIDGDLP